MIYNANDSVYEYLSDEIKDNICELISDYTGFIIHTKSYYNRTKKSFKSSIEIIRQYTAFINKAKEYGFNVNPVSEDENKFELYFHRHPNLYILIDISSRYSIKDELPYTRISEELNFKVTDLMKSYNDFINKAKRYGLDVKFAPDSKNTLELYFNDDYPDQLLVDKDISCQRVE